MAYGIRVSLPGYNALTDTNPDHFALKSDLNDILIKEYTRGTIIVPSSTEVAINHNLGYAPFYLIYYTYNNLKNYAYSAGLYSFFKTYSTTSQIFFKNPISISILINYYIFYDNII